MELYYEKLAGENNFLAGLVIHGGVQGWWIAPVLGSLKEILLMKGQNVAQIGLIRRLVPLKAGLCIF